MTKDVEIQMRDVFAGELQLINWGESGTGGAWVKFQVAAEDLEKFRHLRTVSGKRAGNILAAVIKEIPDPAPADAAPASVPVGQPLPSRRIQGPNCMLAIQWCKHPIFQKWLGVKSESQAKAWILETCAPHGAPPLLSRSELDTNHDAVRRFGGVIRSFRDHVKSIGVKL